MNENIGCFAIPAANRMGDLNGCVAPAAAADPLTSIVMADMDVAVLPTSP